MNSLVYGIIALCLSGFLAYGKLLNLSLGGYFIALAYVIHDIVTGGFDTTSIIVGASLIVSYFFVNWLLLRFFPHEKQRDHVGLVITLGLGVVLENYMNFVYGPNSVSFELFHISDGGLLLLLIGLFLLFFYFFGYTSLGTVFKGIYEKEDSIRSLGVRSSRLLQGYFFVLFVLLALAVVLTLNDSAIRSSDGLFYLIKGTGVMILVGIQQKEYMLLGALLYVLTEYLFFITLGLPIAYKESLVLVIILLVLVLKPEGLFSRKKRKL